MVFWATKGNWHLVNRWGPSLSVKQSTFLVMPHPATKAFWPLTGTDPGPLGKQIGKTGISRSFLKGMGEAVLIRAMSWLGG